MSPVATIDDLALYLNNPAISGEPRAQFILDLAHTLCSTIIDPLPPTARVVVLDVAERAYANPSAAGGRTLGLYAEGEGPFSDVDPGHTGGGLWLTDNNKAMLRNLAGAGGAFSINLLAGYCPPALPLWDVNNTTGEILVEE